MAAPQQGASAALAGFAAGLRWEDVPQKVRHDSKRALINFFATALAGCKDPALVAATAVFDDFRSAGDCHVIGGTRTTDALHAASLNAMAGNVFDFDDTHMPTIIHPTAPVAPAVFAFAQMRHQPGPISGQDLLTAFAAGVEIECRLGNAVSPWHYQRGWHITSTCGVFGAAAACGLLLGLDAQRMTWALGNASAQSAGLVETLGTMAKSIGVGNSASNGILSALLAHRGFEGPAFPIEGPRGFLKVMGDKADPAPLALGLGETWELSKNAYKPYPCGVVLNPVIEACLALYHEDGVRLAQVERVELTGHSLLRERTDRAHPRSGREAQVSGQHAISMALARGRAGLDEFSDASMTDPAASALSDKVRFIDDNSFVVDAATVKLFLRDGKQVSRHVAAARGCLEAPLTDADIENKLRELCRWGGSGCEPQPLIDALWSLDTRADAGSLMQLAAGRA